MTLNVQTKKNKYAISNKHYHYADKNLGKRFTVNDELVFTEYDVKQMLTIRKLKRASDSTDKYITYTFDYTTITPNQLLSICNNWIHFYGSLLSRFDHVKRLARTITFFDIFDIIFKRNLIKPYYASILNCDNHIFSDYTLCIANYFVKNFNDCNKYFITDVKAFLKEKITTLDSLKNWCERFENALLLPFKMYVTLGNSIKDIYPITTKAAGLDYKKLHIIYSRFC